MRDGMITVQDSDAIVNYLRKLFRGVVKKGEEKV
jgi:hypothetical protein